MKKISFSILTILALLLSLLPIGQAQAQAADITIHLDQVDISSFPTVSVHLNTWDASGLPLENLSAADFVVQEDGSAAVPAFTVQADSQAPLAVALALDISGSMDGKPLADARSAAARFLDRLKPGDQAALLTFANQVNPELAFTSDLTPIYNHVDKLSAGGNTALYEAVTEAARMTASLPAGHRAILLLSDGDNQPADAKQGEASIQSAKQANIPFFVIGLGNQINAAYVQRLAIETGGFFRAAPTSSELAKLFTDTATLLKTQYKLSFNSTLNPDGAQHSLTIKLKRSSTQAQADIRFGPLPAAPQITDTAQPPAPITPTRAPVITETPEPAAALILPAPTDAPPPPSFMQQYGTRLVVPLICLIMLIILVFVIIPFFRRRNVPPTPAKEVCANCGYDMTNESGACPICKSTKRLPKMN